jgi:beta-N-acetylhexosaminidase
VSAPLEALRRLDFAPFAALNDMPAAMTAHIVYDALDSDTPATWSRAVVQNTIRQEIGFKGTLMSDDITMKALDGPLATRAQRSLEAGCDLVLLCNADFEERREVLDATPPLAPADFQRLDKLMTPPPPEPADLTALRLELDKLLTPQEISR